MSPKTSVVLVTAAMSKGIFRSQTQPLALPDRQERSLRVRVIARNPSLSWKTSGDLHRSRKSPLPQLRPFTNRWLTRPPRVAKR